MRTSASSNSSSNPSRLPIPPMSPVSPMSPASATSQSRPAILQVKDVSVGYNQQTALLKNLNFDIFAGEIFMVVGRSGVGKTSLLQSLISLVPPLQGTIEILGENLYALQEEQRNKVLQSIGVTYQQGALFSSLNVFENLALPLREFTDLPQSMIEAVCRLKLSQVSLTGFEDFLPDQLSGGMVKRVAIARALMMDPSIIFFDEPGSGLDPILAHDLDRLIVNLAHEIGVTFVIVSHDLNSVFQIADRVALLDRAQQGISFIGKPQDSPQLKEMLQVMATVETP